jgi:hypothetical protein
MSERDRDREPESASAEPREDGEADGQHAGLQEPAIDAEPADALGPEETAALAAWAAPDPPPGFAERVVAARERMQPVEAEPAASPIFVAPPVSRSWRRARPWIAVAVAAVVALLLVQLRAPGGGASLAGSAAPLARESIRLGPRGVAVAEAGSLLSWTIEGGRARVSQRAGDVFYRVERGGGFEVETPHGTVRVTGTCFRVELDMMKKPWQGVVGAAIGAALVVTVYEGSVLLASRDGSERAVAAGQVASSSEQGVTVSDARGPAAAAGAGTAGGPASAPSADATRDELLRRDSQQRAELATLRARMRQLEQSGGPRMGGGERDASGRPWFDPSKEDLVRFASECRVRADMPSFLHDESIEWGPRRAQEAGLSDQELAAVNKVLQDMQREVLAQLRALYIEVTGDQERADELSPQAMVSELQQKSPQGEEGRVNQRIAHERAGLAAPPAELSQASALERYIRRRAGLGDETQRRIGDVIGAARARQLRETDGGWGGQWETVGCPEDGEEQDVQQR